MAKYLVLAATITVPALASAEPHPALLDRGQPEPIEQPDQGARSRITLNLGLFTPVGELGFEYTQMVVRFLEIGASVGVGFSGPQAAIMPRLRAGGGPISISIGAGLSGGAYTDPFGLSCPDASSVPCSDNGVKATLLWTNAEGGIQWTSHGGVVVRLYAGAGRVLTHGTCRNGECDRVDGMTLPYAGLAFGHTL